MFIFVQSQEGQGLQNGYKGALALGALLWLILSLSGCSHHARNTLWIMRAVTT